MGLNYIHFRPDNGENGVHQFIVRLSISVIIVVGIVGIYEVSVKLVKEPKINKPLPKISIEQSL